MRNFTPENIEAIKDWIRSEAKGLPDAQAAFLLSVLDMVSVLLQDKTTQKKALETLRQVLGILPKSERGSTDRFDIKPSGSPLSLLTPEAQLEKEVLEKQIRTLLNRYQRKFGRTSQRHSLGTKARQERKSPRHGGAETLYISTHRMTQLNEIVMNVDRKAMFSNVSGLRSSKEKVTRFDFDVVISENTYIVETVTDPSTGQSVRASMEAVGPEGWQLTWNAMVNVVNLIVVFAVPAHRAAAFLGNDKKAFGQTTLLRVIEYVARATAPIYLEIGRQMAQSLRLQGDDSSTRVLAVERDRGEGVFVNSSEDNTEDNKTFEHRSESGRGPGSMTDVLAQVDRLFGFAFLTKKGKVKKKLQITMLTGRVVATDQFSQISFVRTHLGALGNLVEQLLKLRKPEHKTLVMQSDLSSANIPSENRGFDLTYAGCAAHARRAFWRYRDVDPLNCYFLLRGFQLLTLVEDLIDCHDRTEDASQYWRGRWGLKIWTIMRTRCEKMMTQHMPNSELHLAAQYIVKHFEKLTYYLKDSWVHPTNNQVERILRTERVMLNNSKFRQSRGGRQAYDIIRTLQLCCAGAGVSFLDYLKWALINQRKATERPQDWTPYAYRLQLKPQTK